MERLISLFREPEYEPGLADDAEAPQATEAQTERQPLYYQQLLQYLREQNEQAEADTLIGA